MSFPVSVAPLWVGHGSWVGETPGTGGRERWDDLRTTNPIHVSTGNMAPGTIHIHDERTGPVLTWKPTRYWFECRGVTRITDGSGSH